MKAPKILVFAASAAALGLAPAEAFAQAGALFQINQKLDALQADVDALSTEVAELRAEAPLEMEVVVDIDFCSFAASQCQNFGPQAAALGNNHPVSVIAAVTRGGQPVTDLLGEFDFQTSFVAPGGAAAEFCSDIDCTTGAQQESNGVYALRLVPVGSENWQDGVYAGRLSVTDDDQTVSKLVTFTIPTP